jgi:DNA-binding transcriptional LysR family regulator
MELRQLKYFVAVAEALHFRRAAEIVHVAQPALSHQIKQLETQIGATLFERSHHKVQLTQAGKAFYAKAQSILKDVKLAAAEARAVEHGDAGLVVIGFVSSAAINVLPKVLANIRKQMARTEVELKELATGEQIDCLYHNTIDLGFFHAKLEESAFDSLVVARDRLIVALPKTNKFALRQTVDLRDLAQETAIMPGRHSTHGYFEHIRAAYQAAGVQFKHVHHTNLLQTGLLLVGAGLGISLVPESFRNIRVKGVVYRDLRTERVPVELLAAWRRDNNSPVLIRIIDHLRSEASVAVE